jgi:hypothetical protein
MFCVYCNKECGHTSLQHKCRNCNKTGHTTSYCKAFSNDWRREKFYNKHECVKRDGQACAECTHYVKKTYVYERSHMYLLQSRLKTCLYLYSEHEKVDITEAEVEKLTKCQLVTYSNLMNQISNEQFKNASYTPNQTFDELTEQCEACEGDCTGSGICGICLNGHCICMDIYYLHGKCVATRV